ncbi:MAG: hypothetical protein ABS36_16990 [Acidobacteria bacterium SCN 69-37]|nr:MAG: hypothetical protein ABS36_16990 [Acidobacteria bacterium SCN 69-37]
MARIVVLMFPEPGHLLPTVRLAARLLKDGHSVTYATLPCYRSALCDLGFDLRAAFEDPLERTNRPVVSLPLWTSPAPGVDLWRSLGAAAGISDAPVRTIIRAVAATVIVPAVVDGEPDLLLCDAKIAAACGDVLARSLPNCRLVAIRTELPIGDPVAHLDLVLCPVQLELPTLRSVTSGRHYCEASVFRRRLVADGSTGVADVRGHERLIFCSLGTQAVAYEQATAVLSRVIGAFAGRDGYRLVVAAGALADRVDDASQAANVEICRSVDQLRVLSRASLAVLHGGLGGVKEAVLAGVPMVVVPFVFDQRPNADRVVAHDLGAMVLPGDATADLMRRTADDVLSDARIASGVARMQAIFRDAESRDIAFGHVTRVLEEVATR